MAASGSFSGNIKSGHYTVRVDWSASQSTANNTSTITAKIYLVNDWSLSIGSRTNKITINGKDYSFSSSGISSTGTHLLATVTSDAISHSSDGTKSISMSVTFNIQATISGTYYGSITGSSGSITLNTIPRASTISSAGNITLGNACSIAWTPASSRFKYKVKFVLGSWNHTTDYISPNKTSSYTYTDYTIPVSVANQLPSSTTGTMTAYLYTYNGSSQIGSTSSKTFTVTVPSSVKPTLGNITATIVNSNSTINGWGVAVAGYTKVKLEATASGANGSTISSFTITGRYSTTQNGTSLSYTGAAITSSGSKSFTVVAKDSRSRNSDSKTSNSITFYAYSKPVVSSFTATRSSSDSTKIIVKGNWSYADVNGHNSVTATLQYKRSNASNWSNYGTIAKNTNVTLTNTFNEAYSYNFRLVVTDSLGQSGQDEAFVSTVAVLMDFRAGGKGLGIGKIAESDNLEVALNSIFIGDVYIKVDSSNISLKNYIKKVMNNEL